MRIEEMLEKAGCDDSPVNMQNGVIDIPPTKFYFHQARRVVQVDKIDLRTNMVHAQDIPFWHPVEMFEAVVEHQAHA